MDIKRRIQLGAAAIVVNGIATVALMAPVPVIAGSCGPTSTCVPTSYCSVAGVSYCISHTPSGCTFVSATCADLAECNAGSISLVCQYT